MGGRHLGELGQRGLGIALQQSGVGHEMAGRCDGHAGLAGAVDLRLGGNAVAQCELDPRLHDARGAVVGIGLERVHQLDPRSAHVPRLERGDTALIGGPPAARTGGEQGKSEEGRAESHGCRSYCFMRS